MGETIKAVFDTASTADAAVRDLEVARIPSAIVRLMPAVAVRLVDRGHRQGDSDSTSLWNSRSTLGTRPLVTVGVEGIHAAAVIGILEQHGPMHIEARAA